MFIKVFLTYLKLVSAIFNFNLKNKKFHLSLIIFHTFGLILFLILVTYLELNVKKISSGIQFELLADFFQGLVTISTLIILFKSNELCCSILNWKITALSNTMVFFFIFNYAFTTTVESLFFAYAISMKHVYENICAILLHSAYLHILLICYLFECRFKQINNLLKNTANTYIAFKNRNPTNAKTQNVEVMIKLKHLDGIKCLANKFEHANEILENFNKSLRYVFVLFIISICITFIRSFSYVAVCIVQFSDSSMKSSIKEQSIFDINWNAMIIIIPVILNKWSHAALTALIGERLQEEGYRTTTICYSFLNKFSTYPEDVFEERIKEQLLFLLEQSKSRKICLHAGGIFTLNWGIIGIIAHTVATYSIVIVQFIIK